MKQTLYEVQSLSVMSKYSLSFLTKQYSSILFTTANHSSPYWATRKQFTLSLQKRSSVIKCNWRRKQL